MRHTLSFDDVLLVPAESSVLPSDTDVSTMITNKIKLNAPIMSAAMDTVTGANMAIAMARCGGIGCIHRNLSIEDQVKEVKYVKKCEGWMVSDPVTVWDDASVSDVIKVMHENQYSGVPVISRENGVLVGIVTNRDIRFLSKEEGKQPVKMVMTTDLVTVPQTIGRIEALQLFHKHRIERLIVVNSKFECIGLITVKDIERLNTFPDACKDELGRLRVAAAIGSGGIKRAEALIEAGVDVIVVDTAHGHSENVRNTIIEVKQIFPDTQIIGGNIATASAAEYLIDAGVDAVKVGIGPGSICTTRIVTGVGIPQLQSILDVSEICRKRNVRLIADGGIKFSGDIAKAIAAGADAVMIGSLLAGADESPGELILHNGRAYKRYQGMGSLSSMQRGFSSDRYSQQFSSNKFVPEGVEGKVPRSGPVADIIYQLIGGVKSSMGYTGNANIQSMKTMCNFVSITSSGMRESHAHDVIITRESPNYARRNLED